MSNGDLYLRCYKSIMHMSYVHFQLELCTLPVSDMIWEMMMLGLIAWPVPLDVNL